MRTLNALLAALATVPLVGLATLQAAAPAFADTPGVSPTCFPQSLNPHPTDPTGSTTATLFCTTPTPSPNANGSGTGSGSAGSGSGSSNGAGTTAGAGQTSRDGLADSAGAA